MIIFNLQRVGESDQVVLHQAKKIMTSHLVILMICNLKIMIFTRSPSTEGDRVYKLKICLFVCHHFKISNIGPLYHSRITPGPTYHILLGRG